MSTEQIADRVAALEMAELARTALNDYCLALDTGDFTLLSRTFADDARLVVSIDTEITGRSAIVTTLQDATANKVEHRKHFVSNVAIRECSPDRASGDCYFLSMLSDPGEPVLAWGRFDFEVARTADGAELATLVFHIEQLPIAASAIAAR